MEDWTRCRVAAATRGLCRRTSDTVARDTPACLAMSLSVLRCTPDSLDRSNGLEPPRSVFSGFFRRPDLDRSNYRLARLVKQEHSAQIGSAVSRGGDCIGREPVSIAGDSRYKKNPCQAKPAFAFAATTRPAHNSGSTLMFNRCVSGRLNEGSVRHRSFSGVTRCRAESDRSRPSEL